MEELRNTIVKTIQDKPVVVYAKNGCPFCIRTRDRLEKFVEIDEKETGNWIDVTGHPDYQKVLASETLFKKDNLAKEGLKLKKNQATVPNIWIGKEQIGGCDDFMNLSDEQLKERLQAAGAE